MAHDERIGRLAEALVTIAGDLDLPSTLRRIVEAAAGLVGARYAALGVVGQDRSLSEFVHHGVDENLVHEIGHLPEGRGILGMLLERPVPLRLDNLAAHDASYGFPAGHPPMRSFLGVPIVAGGQVFGNLYLTEKQDGASFTAEDEELVVAMASVAGAAIERVRLHEELQRLSILEERERIGRDLHDTVIQRLFAAGLGLQAVARRCDRPEVVGQVDQAVEDLDDTIREIRHTIFSLQTSDALGAGVRRELLALASDLAPALGFEPKVRFRGPVDVAVTGEVAGHLAPVLREGLTNVAKHAGATAVDVTLRVVDGHLVLEVSDDGVGYEGDREDGHGLRNLRSRARQLGGSFSLLRGEQGGTTLRWRVPLVDDPMSPR